MQFSKKFRLEWENRVRWKSSDSMESKNRKRWKPFDSMDKKNRKRLKPFDSMDKKNRMRFSRKFRLEGENRVRWKPSDSMDKKNHFWHGRVKKRPDEKTSNLSLAERSRSHNNQNCVCKRRKMVISTSLNDRISCKNDLFFKNSKFTLVRRA